MTTTHIDALARLLDGDPADGEVTAETRALAALAAAMESRAAGPRLEFRNDLRAMLVAEARQIAARPSLTTRLRDAVDRRTERWRYSARVAAASASAAVVLSGGGVAMAAEHALPGDLLFGIKTAIESVNLNLTRGDLSRGELLLAHADDRVSEAFLLAGRGDDEHVAQAMVLADDSAREGAQLLLRAFQSDGDRAVLDVLSAFTAAQRARIDELAPLVGGPAVQAIDDYRTSLGRIEARVALFGGQACAECEREAVERRERGEEPLTPPAGTVDLTYIPPAREPFHPCPCLRLPTGPLSLPVVPRVVGDPTGDPTPPLDTQPTEPPPQGDDPTTPPSGEEPPPSEDPRVVPELPGPLEEPGNTVDDIIQDILRPVPVPPPPAATPEAAPANVPDVDAAGVVDGAAVAPDLP